MDLEVQVRRRSLRVARVPDEPEHVSGMDLVAVDRKRREGGKVRVVEEIPLPVAHPEPVAADIVPPDGEDRPRRDGEDRRAQRREDVVAVVPAT